MNRHYLSLTMGLLAMTMASAVVAAPSRLFLQETNSTAPTGSVSIDFGYDFAQAGAALALRIGAFGGEVLINSHPDSGGVVGASGNIGLSGSSIGFKKKIDNDLAAYGVFSFYDESALNTDATDFAIGAAYTMKTGNMKLNLNPELITDDGGPGGPRGGDSTILVKGGVDYPLQAFKTGSGSFIAEVILENSDFLDAMINLGVRWAPKKNITLDFIIYNDRGDPLGTGNDDTQLGIPGGILANIHF